MEDTASSGFKGYVADQKNRKTLIFNENGRQLRLKRHQRAP